MSRASLDSVTKLTAVTHTAGLGVPVQPGFLTLVEGHEASKVHIRQATETSTLENSPESTDGFFFFKYIQYYYFLILVWPRSLACGISVPQPGNEPARSAVEARSLNHWTATEIPGSTGSFLKPALGLACPGIVGRGSSAANPSEDLNSSAL